MDQAARDLVVEIDTLLFGDPRGAAEQARQQAWKLEDPLAFACSSEATYYLSDGGHSRLVFDDEGGVGLSGVSTTRARARWQHADVQDAAGRLRDHMRGIIEREVAAGHGQSSPSQGGRA